MPWQTIKKIIQKELGRPTEEVFLSVDPVPLASASVAQVHCAGVTGSCFLAPILQVFWVANSASSEYLWDVEEVTQLLLWHASQDVQSNKEARGMCPSFAVLRDSRKEVVIKVLKPGVEDVLATDLDFLYLASRCCNASMSRSGTVHDLPDIRQLPERI